MKQPGRSIAPHIKAEAASWLARLRSEERTAGDEAGFKAWLAADVRHRQAFSLVTNVWDEAGGAAAAISPRPPFWTRRKVMAGSAVTVAAVGGAGFWTLVMAESYATAHGEQRRITLADGSVVLLDTDTRIRVALEARQRRVALENGRAHFQVASDPERPFIVTADGQDVIAIGTAFDVARLGRQLSVVLVEGKVAVKPSDAPAAEMRMIRPGDRLVVDPGRAPRVDRPALDMMTAWQNGRVVFDNEPLRTAVAEMNRYSTRPVVIADPALGETTISGVYTTGDVEAFARSVSTLLAISVAVEADHILLGKATPNRS